MWLNPLYQVLKEAKLFNDCSQFLQNKEKRSYCLITLPSDNTILTMTNKNYRPDRSPHLSVYQYYKKNETHGLSVCHFTWYGFYKENEMDAPVLVTLHVYFDRVGRVLFSTLKNRKPGISSRILSLQKN